MSSSLVEYSKQPFEDYVPVVQRLEVASNAPGGILGGTIRLSLNTTDDANAAVQAHATSAQIFVGNATAYDVKIALENMRDPASRISPFYPLSLPDQEPLVLTLEAS